MIFNIPLPRGYWIVQNTFIPVSNIYLKADMNSDILLQTAAIFFSDELLSETGYWLGVCHGSFHLHGLPPAARSGSEIYKMNNPQWDSNSRPLDS